MAVADIGAGSGRISAMISPKVGPTGKVFAVDIQDEMLSLVRAKRKQQDLTNIETVLSTQKSPKLKPNSIDLAFMVDVYHEFNFPYEMTLELSKALKPGGRLVWVEYRKEDPKVRRTIKLVHTMTEAQVKKEALQKEFGLKWKKTIDVLPVQHVIVFEKLKRRRKTLSNRKRAAHEVSGSRGTKKQRAAHAVSGWFLFIADCVRGSLAIANRRYRSEGDER